MALVYVRTTGNDTTGTGATGAPFATLTKAMTVAGAGDTIRVGDGTYAENTGSGGWWAIAKSVADWLTIESESGIAAGVVIMGTSGVSNTIFNGGASAYLRFRNLTFGARSGSLSALRFNAACANIEFLGCRIDASGSASATGAILHTSGTAQATAAFTDCTIVAASVGTCYAIQAQVGGTGTLSATFTRCAIVGSTVGAVQVISQTGTGAALTLIDCALTGNVGVVTTAGGALTIAGGSVAALTGSALNVNGSPAAVVRDALISCSGAANAVAFGVDGVAGNATAGSITRCTITRRTDVAGHGLIIGAGCVNVLVEAVTITQVYDYALVIKENTGTEVRFCTLIGGRTAAANAALYFKAASSANAHHNRLVAGTSYGVRVLYSDVSGHKSQNVTLTENQIVVRGAAQAIEWGDATQDAGGGVCDRNRYDVRSSGGFGHVRATAGITTLAGLRAAWAGYSASNDQASRRAPRPIAVVT